MQEVEARISELKDKATDLTQREKQTETRILKSDDTLRDLQNNDKENNIHIIRVPEGKERVKRPGKLFEEIMVEKFLSRAKETDLQVT